MVNSAGGLHFNQPSQDLTHIVMGETDQGVKVFLEKATHRSVYIKLTHLKRDTHRYIELDAAFM